MFKRPVSQFIQKTLSKQGRAELYNDAKGNFKKIQSLYHTPKQHFSQVDQYLRRLRRPLYYYIIGANLGVFLAWKSNLISYNFLFNHFTLSTMNLRNHRYHTLLTYSFSHVELFHFLFNMITFYFFGRVVEAYFGSKVLLHLWLAGGLTSAFFINSVNAQTGNMGPAVGASGAVYAILAYYIMNFPYQTVYLYFFPVQAWILGLGLVGLSVLSSERGSGAGHLGGLLAGAGYFLYRRGMKF